jgi:hypothetical protein
MTGRAVRISRADILHVSRGFLKRHIWIVRRYRCMNLRAQGGLHRCEQKACRWNGDVGKHRTSDISINDVLMSQV